MFYQTIFYLIFFTCELSNNFRKGVVLLCHIMQIV
nr:MAG TPA: hypothetical protein [Caudoviricetes sp.]